MRRIRTLIVDDEPLARDGIAMLAGRDREVEIVGVCPDGESALRAIRRERPDLVFLDVQMPTLGGIEVLESLAEPERPAVVFVTAHHQYAVQAFEMCAVDYVLKPFADDRFESALARAKDRIRSGDADSRAERLFECLRRLEERDGPAAAGPDPAGRLAFKVGGEFLLVGPDEIAWFEASGDLVKFRAGGQVHQVRETLQGIERRLDPRRFLRIHRSYVVNVGAVRRIAPTAYGDYDLVMNDGVKIRVSRNFRDRLKAILPGRDS
jgi:two-component system LytT family response regulator